MSLRLICIDLSTVTYMILVFFTAAQTRNYTGSELELLVKIAQGGALASQLLKNKGIPTTEGIKLTMEDFISAMDVVKPEMESLKENLKRSRYKFLTHFLI